MKTYNLKSVVRRGTMLTAAFVIAGASLLPFTSASADALNPLTDRSLTLSSSAPGWDYLDGSGNETYAAPNSGANGRQTGNTFAFKVSSDSTSSILDSMTFQYCTAAAGDCTAPGNGAFNVANKTSNLEVVTNTPTEIDNATTPIISAATGNVITIPNEDDSQGSFIVMYNNAGTWTQSTGWEMAATNVETGSSPTGEENFITLSQTTPDTTGLALAEGTQVKVFFFATDDNYITNPGEGAFFVRINTFSDDAATTLVDGGVTVANVMNLGISIQTKVLETMDFSVGTVDPYTLETLPDLGGGEDLTSQFALAYGGSRVAHGGCDPVLNAMLPTDTPNTLKLGDEENDYSLDTDNTYSTHSYFRLSSNASAGATVYYSGVTLSNTVGDEITPMATKLAPSPGNEQFGLALANGTDNTNDWEINYAVERAAGNVYESGADNAAKGITELVAGTATTGVHSTVQTDWLAAGITGKLPQLTVHSNGTALAPIADYNDGAGVVNGDSGYGNIDTSFKFEESSNTIPVAIATEGTEVVDCASAKVRYIANIAATTPAGIYTTKINYIAAPQY